MCDCFSKDPAAAVPHKGCGELVDRFPLEEDRQVGFALCFLCRMDLQIASRGLTSLHENWKSTEHQLRGIKYRLQHDKPMVNKSCKEVSKKKYEQHKTLVIGMALVHLKSTFTLCVAQVLDAEKELE